MTKAKTARGTKSKRPLVPIHRNAAGLDVGATFHVVAVPPGRDPEPVRSFKSFTGDLHALADWLKSVGVTTVAMESTGVYWVPVFEILEARGFEVLLVNARNVKNVPGRKTEDVTVVFGHWSTLGLTMRPNLIGLDTGCVWGGKLTAVRLDNRAVLQVDCPQYLQPGV